jgi:hypothetical protein
VGDIVFVCKHLPVLRHVIRLNQRSGTRPPSPPECGAMILTDDLEKYLHPLETYHLVEFNTNMLGDVIIFGIAHRKHRVGYLAAVRIVDLGNAI